MVHHQCGFRSTSLDSLRDSYIPYSIYDRVGNGFIGFFFLHFLLKYIWFTVLCLYQESYSLTYIYFFRFFSFIKWKWKSLTGVWLFETLKTIYVHGILQAKIMEWVAFPFSRGSFCILVLSHLRLLTDKFFMESIIVNTPLWSVSNPPSRWKDLFPQLLCMLLLVAD